MGPVAKAVNILQGVSDIQTGWPLPYNPHNHFQAWENQSVTDISQAAGWRPARQFGGKFGEKFFGPRTTDEDVLKLGDKTTTSKCSTVSFWHYIEYVHNKEDVKSEKL